MKTESKLRFFDQTFKVLVSLSGCVWIMYFVLIFLVGDEATCSADNPRQLFVMAAWTVGVISALPMVYGLGRLLFGPGGPRRNGLTGSIIISGAGVFVAGVILFALAIAEYGCQ